MDLISHIHKNPFLLAPMAGITDIAFRRFMRSMGASVVTTELVSANGLLYKNERTKRLMKISSEETPVGIQIFGEDIEALCHAAKVSQDMGADFVDLNFGCPVTKVVKKGAGSAVLKDLDFMSRMLEQIKKAISIDLTIKIRTGWNEDSKNAEEVCKVAYQQGVTWVAIHGRTRAQAYNGKADWDYIKKVKEQSPLPIIGNGDLTSAQLANLRLTESSCDAVMIGRGALKNPWIFLESQSLKEGKVFNKTEGIQELTERLYSYYAEDFEERVCLLQLKKFSSWFSSGYPNSSKFRKALFSSKEKEAVLEVVLAYFEEIKNYRQKDTSHENFLMGGHG